jgi:hypothetical protein
MPSISPAVNTEKTSRLDRRSTLCSWVSRFEPLALFLIVTVCLLFWFLLPGWAIPGLKGPVLFWRLAHFAVWFPLMMSVYHRQRFTSVSWIVSRPWRSQLSTVYQPGVGRIWRDCSSFAIRLPKLLDKLVYSCYNIQGCII